MNKTSFPPDICCKILTDAIIAKEGDGFQCGIPKTHRISRMLGADSITEGSCGRDFMCGCADITASCADITVRPHGHNGFDRSQER